MSETKDIYIYIAALEYAGKSILIFLGVKESFVLLI